MIGTDENGQELLAIGQVARGVIVVGQLAIGVIAFGQLIGAGLRTCGRRRKAQ